MSADLITIRPRRSLMVTAVLSFLAAMVPIFGVLYWFASARDAIVPVSVVHAIVLAIGAGVLLRQLQVRAVVTDTQLTGNGIFSPTIRVDLDDIEDVLLVETHVGPSPDTVTQLIARDVDGHTLFRMRGNFWHEHDLEALVAALPVPVTRVAGPLSMAEFFDEYPGSVYWFENRPGLKAAAAAAGLIALAGVIVLVTSVLGFSIPGM
ncbi:MAG: hypothetical protein CMF56_11995 [Leifsonia sp.]|nr:hypothetical protein [Leifsonia sp.]MAT19258.1 hypothetical protein [Leifsonia sp.]